ncbi:MAG: helix-turn-helix transcriptional regulator [candidate division KSB1 bacterium]|nr:helix-turn-helix transcriptional regulator [candidate division KSB1 bacterium]
MSDLENYIHNRKKTDPDFRENFEKGYKNFKIGVLLRQARIESGMTQEQIAHKMNTKKSSISRIENHSEDIRLSTLENYARALGKRVKMEIVES